MSEIYTRWGEYRKRYPWIEMYESQLQPSEYTTFRYKGIEDYIEGLESIRNIETVRNQLLGLNNQREELLRNPLYNIHDVVAIENQIESITKKFEKGIRHLSEGPQNKTQLPGLQIIRQYPVEQKNIWNIFTSETNFSDREIALLNEIKESENLESALTYFSEKNKLSIFSYPIRTQDNIRAERDKLYRYGFIELLNTINTVYQFYNPTEQEV